MEPRGSGFTVRRSCRCATSPFRFQAACKGDFPCKRGKYYDVETILSTHSTRPGVSPSYFLHNRRSEGVRRRLFWRFGSSRQKKRRQNLFGFWHLTCLELAIGLEPTTTGLQNQGSTIELRQRFAVLASYPERAPRARVTRSFARSRFESRARLTEIQPTATAAPHFLMCDASKTEVAGRLPAAIENAPSPHFMKCGEGASGTSSVVGAAGAAARSCRGAGRASGASLGRACPRA